MTAYALGSMLLLKAPQSIIFRSRVSFSRSSLDADTIDCCEIFSDSSAALAEGMDSLMLIRTSVMFSAVSDWTVFALVTLSFNSSKDFLRTSKSFRIPEIQSQCALSSLVLVEASDFNNGREL